MDDLVKIQEDLDPTDETNESEFACMKKILVRQCQSSDELFFKTGVDEDFLSYCIKKTKLNLEPEFV